MACVQASNIADPTGCGDAYRGACSSACFKAGQLERPRDWLLRWVPSRSPTVAARTTLPLVKTLPRCMPVLLVSGHGKTRFVILRRGRGVNAKGIWLRPFVCDLTSKNCRYFSTAVRTSFPLKWECHRIATCLSYIGSARVRPAPSSIRKEP